MIDMHALGHEKIAGFIKEQGLFDRIEQLWESHCIENVFAVQKYHVNNPK
jgi:hypothetical protein